MMIDPVLLALSPPLADQRFQALPNVAASAHILDKISSLTTGDEAEDSRMAGTGEEEDDDDEDSLPFLLSGTSSEVAGTTTKASCCVPREGSNF
ncbi:hypothetical protein LZ554_004606 [Drepanopeziza brunnea f. sp. 'monogermtubi']|nr:hypothetical protein LZ554_004606 [Drepanopeziza brunnea f. sp. 'monogermtubi']